MKTQTDENFVAAHVTIHLTAEDGALLSALCKRRGKEAPGALLDLLREESARLTAGAIQAALLRISGVPAGETMIDRVSDEDWLGDEMLNANICAGKSE